MRDFSDTTYANNILTSLLWNLSFKLNDNNQIGFICFCIFNRFFQNNMLHQYLLDATRQKRL
jgi:hypothetical protein